MNIVNDFLLRMALVPGLLYERLGVNTVQLKTIVSTKLLIDDRRPNTFQQASQKHKQKETTRATVGTMLISVVLGCTFLFAFAISENRTTQLTLFFSMFIFMLASTL